MTDQQTTTLSESEKSEKERLEVEIIGYLEGIADRQKKSILDSREVGQRLITLRDQKLWRDDSDTWDEYCEKTFGFSRDRAGQLIRAYVTQDDFVIQLVEQIPRLVGGVATGDLKKQMSDAGITLPQNERVWRRLAAVPHHLRVVVWLAASRIAKAQKKTKEVSAAMVGLAASGLNPKTSYPKAADKAAKMIADAAMDNQLAKLKEIFFSLDEPHKAQAKEFINTEI